MAKIDALNASLKRLDELTNYADDLMTGIIETDFEKVDKLLADEKMNKKQSLCVYCNLEFSDPVAFIGHLMVRHMHAAAKRVFCRVCRHECEDPKDLQAHVQERHFREPECRLCKAEMNAEHEKVHPFDEWVLLKLACDYCSYTTKDPHQYVVHNMLCTNNPQNENYQPTDEGRVCPICKQVFGCNAYMLRHKQKKHTNAEDQNAVVNQFQCEECGRRFGSILSLGGHKKVHKREGDGDLIRFDKLKRPEDRQTAAASAPPPKRRRTAK
ncbi:hypothetical protein M3Y99_00612100 [Aphelenchoides fujianensis]|nr:hypothetical protein M3Y99_00612100 [Aphelenchoides fujianensis]